MCAVAEGFLLYALIQIAREMRKGRAATAVISISCVASENSAADQPFGKVIEITHGSRLAAQNSGGRMAS